MPRRSQNRRLGFTLMELMLVLGVIVALGAMAAPSLSRTWERQRLKAAAEQLRSVCSRAHVAAMRTGQIQVLRFELGGSQYMVTPWSAGDESINGSAKTSLAYGDFQQAPVAEPLKEQHLPDDITFLDATAEFDTRSQLILEQEMSMPTAGPQWSQPILFYPDGSSSQAEMTVVDKRQTAIPVTLKRLTGMSTIGEMTTATK